MGSQIFKKRFLERFYFLVICYGILLFSSYFIQGFFLFEWIVSFMPYFLGINLVLLIFLFKKRQVYIFFLLLLITLIFSYRFINFSLIKPSPGNGTTSLKIVFFNKHFRNQEYEKIEKAIEKVNPQILGLSEIYYREEEKLTLLNKYPYKKIIDTKEKFAPGLFSKYPMEFLSLDENKFPRTIGAKTNIEGKKYYIFLIHSYNPLTPYSLRKRDKELKALFEYIKGLNSQNVILIGDLNLTPWSPLYRELFPSDSFFLDTAKGRGIITTWGFTLLRTELDHIFVPKNVLIEKFETVGVKSSDHRLIWTEIKI